MSKRFTEADKWNDPWFRKLSPTLKLGYLYLLDRCDNAGVIELDSDLADFMVGERVEWDTLVSIADGRIERLPTGKLWVVKFVTYQFGTLTEASPPHRSVLKLLEKHNLTARVEEGYPRGSNTPQVKDKDREKEKDREKDKGGSGGNIKFSPPTVAEVAAYCAERVNSIDPEQFCDHYEANGWVQGKSKPIRDWRATVRTWEKNNFAKPATTADPRGTLAAVDQYLKLGSTNG